MRWQDWTLLQDLHPYKYTCGFCSSLVSSHHGWVNNLRDGTEAIIFVCPDCAKPSYFYEGEQIPGPPLGDRLNKLPPDIDQLYKEITRTASTGAYTSVVLACRKLLMHIAVENGAKEGLNFVQYVDYLDSNHFTPPKSKIWVDKIRSLGNEANHEIVIMNQNQAKDAISFVGMLLRFLYEFQTDD